MSSNYKHISNNGKDLNLSPVKYKNSTQINKVFPRKRIISHQVKAPIQEQSLYDKSAYVDKNSQHNSKTINENKTNFVSENEQSEKIKKLENKLQQANK